MVLKGGFFQEFLTLQQSLAGLRQFLRITIFNAPVSLCFHATSLGKQMEAVILRANLSSLSSFQGGGLSRGLKSLLQPKKSWLFSLFSFPFFTFFFLIGV